MNTRGGAVDNYLLSFAFVISFISNCKESYCDKNKQKEEKSSTRNIGGGGGGSGGSSNSQCMILSNWGRREEKRTHPINRASDKEKGKGEMENFD